MAVYRNQEWPPKFDRKGSQVEQQIEANQLPRRKRRLSAPSFYDNQSSLPKKSLLSLPRGASLRSESGRSCLSFASISTVNDRGIANHAIWEHGRSQSSSSSALASPNKRDRILNNSKPITASYFATAIFKGMQSADKNQRYLPLDVLEALISPENVQELLNSMPFDKKKVEYVIKGVFGNGRSAAGDPPETGQPNHKQQPTLRRILTILIMIQYAEAIEDFIKSGVDDSILPIRVENGPEDEDGQGFTIHSEGASTLDSTILGRCFSTFTRLQVECFCSHQKKIHVPFFKFPGETSNVSFYDLDSDCILPFTKVGQPSHGGYGTVEKIHIHPAHHNFVGVGKGNVNPAFALKTLLRKSDDGFKKEVEAFERLTPHKSEPKVPDHLMHLELAYRHGDCYCLVFPWANGNLEQYWESHPRDPADHNDVKWFFKQCYGIARGLRRLHNPLSYKHLFTAAKGHDCTADDILTGAQSAEYGRHGDIKPENILWFESYDGDYDHLAISDFGSTEFNSIWSKSHVKADGVNGYTDTYEAPDRQFDPEITQNYDIWSVGCVFLEFISWFLLGFQEGTRNFASSRVTSDPRYKDRPLKDDKFYQMHQSDDHNGRVHAELKPLVVEWIKKLHALESCPKSIHDFLDVVQFSMLKPRAADRKDCGQIREDLLCIYKDCRKDKSYATEGYPWYPHPSGFGPETPTQETEALDRRQVECYIPKLEDPQPDVFPELPEEMRELPPIPDVLEALAGPDDEVEKQEFSDASLASQPSESTENQNLSSSSVSQERCER